MDVDLTVRELIHGLGELHSLDQLLDQDARLRPDDVGAQDLAGVRAGDDLAEMLGVLHRPAVCHAGVVLYSGDVGPSKMAEFLLGLADRGHLRVGEDGVRDRPQIRVAHRFRMDEVVGNGAGLGVGDMFELIVVGHVAECPHAVSRGTQVLVGDHESFRIDFDACCTEIEGVPVRYPTDRDEQRIAGDVVMLAAFAVHANRDPRNLLADAVDPGVQVAIEPALVDLGEAAADRFVLAGQQSAAAVDHDDLAAEAGEHVRHLGCDVAATADDQPLGKIGQTHDGVARVVADGLETSHIWHQRAGTGCDHDVITGDQLGRAVRSSDLEDLG